MSHSKKDKEFVELLERKLRPARVEGWYDNWEIPPGASLRQKIIDEGITKCDLFFVYLTKASIASKWVSEELDAAHTKTFEAGGHLALYADSNEAISKLPLSLKKSRIGLLNRDNIDEAIAPLIASAWEALARTQQAEVLRNKIRVYKDRFDLINNTSFGDSLDGASTFDIVCFSANVLLAFEDHFRGILKDGAKVRIVLFDPGPATKVFYFFFGSGC